MIPLRMCLGSILQLHTWESNIEYLVEINDMKQLKQDIQNIQLNIRTLNYRPSRKELYRKTWTGRSGVLTPWSRESGHGDSSNLTSLAYSLRDRAKPTFNWIEIVGFSSRFKC